ncbi:MMPL family transporter [Nocardiopsis sp. L17-MgMaSL7]|uniref:MMPL family transporter n=1 Tax=Nocardiopsis sp. L17-MgMaSL7 TaxID=1938893 RepID=UPI000D71A29F|nr:MMPL family transporter [Nocardiopsis sp. L17-MgMaSL7]PWV49287.1 RND superfamily putative drug exporter [Nocardiopsis sp. L17-MgMaSL7]
MAAPPVTTPARPTPLARLGRTVARHSGRVLLLATAVALTALVLAAGVLDRLQLSRFESPGSESHQVEQALEEGFGTGKHHFLLLVTAQRGTVDSPEVVEAATGLERELAARDGVVETASYWSRDGSPAMRSDDATQALVTVRMSGTVTEARTALADISPDFTRTDDVIRVEVGGGDEIFRQAAAQAQSDFVRAEIIILPLVLALLLLLYRRVSVAALTLAMGVYSVVTTLALLRGVAALTEVSTFAANLTLVMGIGLGVDYGLFVITRFREELARGHGVAEAVELAVARAGRTVVFSGLTVAIALSCLMLFPFPFLQSFAYAGVGVVLTSVVAALVVLPAALARVGHRVRPRSEPRADRGWWHATALRMTRRPLLYGVPALGLVLLLALPALGINFGLPDARVLPEGHSSRDVQEQIEAGFSQEEMDAVHVLVDSTDTATEEVDAYAAALSRVSGVAQVDARTGTYQDGRLTITPGDATDRFGSEGATWFSVVPTTTALEDASGFIDLLRDVPAPADTAIGGYPADLTDFGDALLERVPLVVGMILAVTFVLLFLMTGSLLLPLKAILLNVLSLAVMFGVIVWVFQEGNLSGVLGFTADGTLEVTFPILMFCVAFGLSMDYEVFMLARIKEEYDLTGDTTSAVAAGLQRSGPLVTAAAVVLAASFAVYATSSVLYLIMLAVGMAAVIVVDATLIRGVLVPVTMRLAGRANWWAPAPLRRVHARLGLSH